MSRTVVIACGNPLRGDDGVAHVLVERLEATGQLPDVQFIQQHQLTPELAEDVSKSDLVVIVDAGAAGEPGSVNTLKVVAETDSPGGFSHDFGPGALLAASKNLYGKTPQAYVVTICAESFEHSEKLSEKVTNSLKTAEEAIRQIIATK